MSEDRRLDYRHTFGPAERIHLGLESPARGVTFAGLLANLSVAGMGVCCPGLAVSFAAREHLVARSFDVVDGMEGEVIYSALPEAGCYVGLRFLPAPSRAALARRQQGLWRFLMELQKRELLRRRWLREIVLSPETP